MLDAPSLAGRIRVLAFALDDDDGREIACLVEALPRVHVRDRVRAQHEEELTSRRGEHLERVGSDRLAVAFDLDGRRLQPVDIFDRDLDQREAIARRGDDPVPLLPRVARGHYEYSIEIEHRSDLRRDYHMGDVHRVERPAEHAQTFPRFP